MRVEFNGPERILLLSINKALKDSGRLVEDVLHDNHFDNVLLSITDEEVDGLREYIRNPVEVEMDDLEIIYEYYMKKFGETSIPPEAYITAIKIADDKKMEVVGIDIPSGIYEEIFVSRVELSDMIRLSLRKRRLLKRKWKYTDPETFSIDWDTYLNRGGYLKVEKERAKYMASQVVGKKKSSTLVVVEAERFNDLEQNLRNILQGYTLLENSEVKTAVSSSEPY